MNTKTTSGHRDKLNTLKIYQILIKMKVQAEQPEQESLECQVTRKPVEVVFF